MTIFAQTLWKKRKQIRIKGMTISESVAWFNNIYDLSRTAREKKADFCCGVTDRMDKWKADNKDAHVYGITKCDSLPTATKLAELLKREGYSIGGMPQSNPDQIYIFLYKVQLSEKNEKQD